MSKAKNKKNSNKPQFILEYKGQIWLGSAYSIFSVFINGNHVENVPVRIDCLKRVFSESQLNQEDKELAEQVMDKAIRDYDKKHGLKLIENALKIKT